MFYIKLLILNVSIFMICTLNAASHGQAGQVIRQPQIGQAMMSHPPQSAGGPSHFGQAMVSTPQPQQKHTDQLINVNPEKPPVVIGSTKYMHRFKPQQQVSNTVNPEVPTPSSLSAHTFTEQDYKDHADIKQNINKSSETLMLKINLITDPTKKEEITVLIGNFSNLAKQVDKFFGKGN